MAKKIKFPLELKDKVQVRTMEQLRENFDMELMITYFLDGKLKTWLEDRYYEEEAEKISKLDSTSVSLKNQLCEALGVEYIDSDIDINEIEIRNERINKLRQYTDDEEIIKKIDSVVFDQEELADVLDEGIREIYLCSEYYTIPNSKKSITYIGIGNPIVKINSAVNIDFDEKRIVFNNLTLTSMNKIKVKADNSKGIKYEGKILTEIENKKAQDNGDLCKSKASALAGLTFSLDKIAQARKLQWQVYIGHNDALYKSREDGSDETLLSEDADWIVDYCVYEDVLCYMIYDKGFKTIYKLNLNDNFSKKEIISFEHKIFDSMPGRAGKKTPMGNDPKKELFCNDKWLVWNGKDSNLMRCNINGEGVRHIHHKASRLTITAEVLGDYLFYIKDNRINELIRINLINLDEIIIDYQVKSVCTNNKDKLFYCRYCSTELGTKTLASTQLGYGHYIYECSLDGSNKNFLKMYHEYNKRVRKIEYVDKSLYYEIEEGLGWVSSIGKYKINLKEENIDIAVHEDFKINNVKSNNKENIETRRYNKVLFGK